MGTPIKASDFRLVACAASCGRRVWRAKRGGGPPSSLCHKCRVSEKNARAQLRLNAKERAREPLPEEVPEVVKITFVEAIQIINHWQRQA